MVHGPQGGWHILGSVRIDAMYENVEIRYTITDVPSGHVVSDNDYFVQQVPLDGCEGEVIGRYGYLNDYDELARRSGHAVGAARVPRGHARDVDRRPHVEEVDRREHPRDRGPRSPPTAPPPARSVRRFERRMAARAARGISPPRRTHPMISTRWLCVAILATACSGEGSDSSGGEVGTATFSISGMVLDMGVPAARRRGHQVVHGRRLLDPSAAVSGGQRRR